MKEATDVAPENGAWLKVAVCVPSSGTWKASTAMSITKMAQHFAKGCAGALEIVAVKGFMLPEQRSRCVAEAWKMEATHLLWVDSDMGFPEDALLRLLKHGKRVVGVNYPRKMPAAIPTAYVDNAVETGPLYTTDDKSGLEEVRHCGFGLMLCEMNVFDELAEDLPLFAFEPQAPYYTRFCTEDVYFCRKLKAHGIPVFIDHDLSRDVIHIGDCTYTNDMALKALDEARGKVSRLQLPEQLKSSAESILAEGDAA